MECIEKIYHKKKKYKTRELGGREAMDVIYTALDSKPWYLGWRKVSECKTAALLLKGIESSLPFPVSKQNKQNNVSAAVSMQRKINSEACGEGVWNCTRD